MTSDVLLTTNVHHSYSGGKVLQNVSIAVQKGDIFGCLGPNGAGKTTLLKCIMGLLPLQQGRIEICQVADLSRRKKGVGAVIETPAFVATMSALDNLLLAQGYCGNKNVKAIEEALGLVDLFDRRFDLVETYSLGMKQRLAIARSLLNDPMILILDEPTNGLDPKGMNDIRLLLQKLNRERGITILLSSHLLHEVEQICNRVCILDHGRLVYQGDISALNEQSDNYWIDAENRELLRTSLGKRKIDIIEESTDGFRINSNDIAGLNQSLHQVNISLNKIAPIQVSLETSFLRLTEEE